MPHDNVLVAGKVAFNENSRSFNDWCESKCYGDSLRSYLMGMSVKEHVEKTRYHVGGIGEPVK
ncbi:MAG: hypothetical protein GX748_16095 [Lentisphaerae bacterium]|nr:hypothetical protein [Lentisphaerota bacterium]